MSTFRRYWWLFAVIAIVILAGLLRLPTVDEDAESDSAAPNPSALADVPQSDQKPQVKHSAGPEVALATDHLELPIPEDVQALARYYGTSGRKNIRDAEVFWQKGTDNYIDFIRNETFEQGTYRTYIPSELWWVTKPLESSSPAHPDAIRYLARTRRFGKLLSQVIEARESGNVTGLVEKMSKTLSRIMQERRLVEKKIMSLIEAEPSAFSSNATREQETRCWKNIIGVGSTGFDAVGIEMSLHGAQRVAVANTFLLGLTGHPDALGPILETLAYDDRPIIDALCACECFSDAPTEKELMAADYVFANRAVVADALDRILVASADNEAVSQNALSLARQYNLWRHSQDLPDRKIQKTFAFDSPTTPYHLPGVITGVKQDAQTFEFKLPLALWERDYHVVSGYRLNEETIQTIIDWAERFSNALN